MINRTIALTDPKYAVYGYRLIPLISRYVLSLLRAPINGASGLCLPSLPVIRMFATATTWLQCRTSILKETSTI